jgi:hypothetical protein
MQHGLQGFLVKIAGRLARKGFQGFSNLLPNNSTIQLRVLGILILRNAELNNMTSKSEKG